MGVGHEGEGEHEDEWIEEECRHTERAARSRHAEVAAEGVERQPPERRDHHRRQPEDAEGRLEDEPEEGTPDDREDRRGGDDREDCEPCLVEQDLGRAGIGPVVGGRHRRQRRHHHRRDSECEEDEGDGESRSRGVEESRRCSHRPPAAPNPALNPYHSITLVRRIVEVMRAPARMEARRFPLTFDSPPARNR
ncbi:MAG: hypothetical protein K0Q89_2787 [Thermomicrobiales bacterium]|nr:hypothetical protein [Thermomicrobiales bacterium]